MVEVLKQGYFITIQDSGRSGFSKFGVTRSGCMDIFSANYANGILSNSNNEAVFEITMMGGEFKFYSDIHICVAGAIFDLKLNNKHIENNKKIKIKKNDILSFGKSIKGYRAYLAIEGGIDYEPVLKSRSMYYPLTRNSIIKKGDKFKFLMNQKIKNNNLTENSLIFKNNINVSKGPEFDFLDEIDVNKVFGNSFTISSNNRMGYFFNENLNANSHSIITSPVIPGTVQLTPSGKIIVIMKDGQVTGGYPRILQLDNLSVSVLSQKKHGDKVKFELISLS